MAGKAIVVKGGTLSCSHSGTATISSSARLTVGGKGVLLSGAESGLSFTGCTNQTTSSPPVKAPCTSDAATSGVATRLTVGGKKVLLTTAGGVTTNTQGATPGKWSVGGPGQTRLSAV